ncbi:MAG: VCBS repeat-containing protein [Polyangiaceae bacterium]|nr:VCBS repeat-containing protein [Polyangiaceae bacterium]
MRRFAILGLVSLVLGGCQGDECSANSVECTSQTRFRTCEYVMSGDHGGSYEWRSQECPSTEPVCRELGSHVVCLPKTARICSSLPVLPGPLPLWSASVGDVSSDSIPDLALVLAYAPEPWLAVALGNTQGTFDPPLLVEELSVESVSDQVPPVLGDLTGDGVPDLVLHSREDSSSVVRWWGGVGSGAFGSGGQFVEEGYPVAMIAADLDQDGRVELVVSSSVSSGIGRASVLGVVNGKLVVLSKLGGAQGPVAHLGGSRFVVGGTVYEMKAGVPAKVQELEADAQVGEAHARDLDKDGDVDVVLVDSKWAPPFQVPVRIYLGDATGQLTLTGNRLAGRGTALADVDRNGLPDLAYAPGDGRVAAYLNDGVLSADLTQAFPNTPPVPKLLVASGLPSAFPEGSAAGERVLLFPGTPEATLRVVADDCFP